MLLGVEVKGKIFIAIWTACNRAHAKLMHEMNINLFSLFFVFFLLPGYTEDLQLILGKRCIERKGAGEIQLRF